jgi:hypothetical protein
MPNDFFRVVFGIREPKKSCLSTEQLKGVRMMETALIMSERCYPPLAVETTVEARRSQVMMDISTLILNLHHWILRYRISFAWAPLSFSLPGWCSAAGRYSLLGIRIPIRQQLLPPPSDGLVGIHHKLVNHWCALEE